jgi:hypothetical protein
MQNPIIISFLLADKVFREMETGKVHIAGTFNQLSAARFPMTHPQFYIYLAITEMATGQRSVSLEFRYIETGLKIMAVEQNVQSRGPIDVLELNMCFNSLQFERDGNVEMVLKIDDREAMTRMLRVKKVDMPPNPNNPGMGMGPT